MRKEKEIQAGLDAVEFSSKDDEKLGRLEDAFLRGVPNDPQLLSTEKEIEELKTLEREIAMQEGKEPTAQEKALLQKFTHVCPTETQIAEISTKVEAYKQAKKEYESMPLEMSVPAASVSTQTSSKLYTLFMVLASLVCAVSAMCFLTDKSTLGIVLLGVGGVLFLVGGWQMLKGKPNTAQEGTMYALNSEKQQKQRGMDELEYSIKAMLTGYGYHSDNGVVYDFAQLQKDAAQYREYVAAEEVRKTQLAEKQTQRQGLEQKLTAFFRGYGLSGSDYYRLLSDLRGMIGEYYSLTDRKNTHNERKTAMENELEERRAKIEAYKRKYGLTELHINDVFEDIRQYSRLCAEIKKEKEQAAAYKEKEGLEEQPVGERIDLAELQAMLTEKQNERSKLEREIEADETEVERVDERQAKLAEAEEKLQTYKQRHRLLKAAKEFLENADGNLKDKYVKPIKDEFLHYADVLEKALGEKVIMTKNFEIRFERDGLERSEKHFSAGQRSICALCFRLALIKNMYKENPPFLILDDPFVMLDDRHMDKVRGLLKELSNDMQMLYFTCHESRMV